MVLRTASTEMTRRSPKWLRVGRGVGRVLGLVGLLSCDASPQSKGASAPPGTSTPAGSVAARTAPPSAAPDALPKLATQELGPIGDKVLVLLHGYGARGDDLVSLGREMQAASGFAVVTAEGPRVAGEGRSWFDLGGAEVPSQVDDAREALTRVLVGLRARGVTTLVVGGFSQGAMMSLDLSLRSDVPLDGAIIFSGGRLAKSGPLRDAWERPTRVPAFPIWVSHGSADPVLPFDEAVALVDQLTADGVVVRWLPTRDRHTISPEARAGAVEFLRSLDPGP